MTSVNLEQSQNPYLGLGIYSIPDAARLLKINSAKIRRWVRGYRYAYQDQAKVSPPVWQGQLPTIGSSFSLGFLDLMEVRFVNAFIERGVSLQSVRKAVERARNLFDTDHPLCTDNFFTDGQTIFMQVGEEADEYELLDLVKNQYAFQKLLKPYMKDLQYQDSDVIRWWPMGKRRTVVIDPTRNFGGPIVDDRGVPTNIIAKSASREGISSTMRWYRLSRHEVTDAVNFEKSLAA